MRVLVIDDDPTILDIVVQYLDFSTKHEVNAVPSAKAALEAISDAEEPFECFLCDIQMPEVDGISLVKLIRQSPGHKQTPIIMLTAMHAKQDLDRAFHAGATDYVTKPFDCVDLPPRMQAAQKLSLEKSRNEHRTYKAGELVGMGGELKEIMLNDPITLPGIESALEYSEFENYLRELLRRRTARLTTVAVKIGSVDHLYAEYTSEQFKLMLGATAAAVQDTLLADGGVLSYRGNGTFLCIPEKGQTLRHRNQETELNKRLRSVFSSGDEVPVQLHIGEQVLLPKHSEAEAMTSLARAVENAEARNGDVSNAFLTNFFNVPRLFFGGRRVGQEQKHLEKRSYEALLNDTIKETGNDVWLQGLLRRDKVSDNGQSH
ncbi:response regulator [Maritimibacter dapengensis]|uniref:Response regulator n=1 Tax=Maritimibacter dapengensis TaxID=2836868 RepID=A0ABS6T4H9_9RHOB|nr:response regulator [Maritimibacter dapengensis]MBV7380152.1 response regulator [Maritimibacter dapengensis]